MTDLGCEKALGETQRVATAGISTKLRVNIDVAADRNVRHNPTPQPPQLPNAVIPGAAQHEMLRC